MPPTNLDWPLLIGGTIALVPLILAFMTWTTPKKNKGRGATRPKNRKHLLF